MHHAPKLDLQDIFDRCPGSKALNVCERCLDPDPTGICERCLGPIIQISSRDSPIDALTLGSQTSARDFTVQNSPTTVEDIPGTKSLVDV